MKIEVGKYYRTRDGRKVGPMAQSEWPECAHIEGQADLSTAARDVLAERARQISAEGWTPEHDDQHVDGEMAQASGCYALNAAGWKTEALRGCWPIKWMAAWFKPTTPRRDLVKAGALIIAEIERLDRATPPADLAAKIWGE